MDTASQSTARHDRWGKGEVYEPYVGRWSRRVAAVFVDWLGLPPGSRWLDVGCGTGALCRAILDGAEPGAIHGVDPAAGFISFARSGLRNHASHFVIGDGRALPVEPGAYHAAISGLVLNFVPAPERMAAEMARAVHPGGTVAVYVWDYAEKMEMMRYFWDAAAALDPAAAELDEGPRFPLCSPAGLAELFERTGLRGVETRPIEIPTHFSSFDDYWSPFLGGMGPAPGYLASLAPDLRVALGERIRAALPVAADGSIPLVARAWAARGVRQ